MVHLVFVIIFIAYTHDHMSTNGVAGLQSKGFEDLLHNIGTQSRPNIFDVVC